MGILKLVLIAAGVALFGFAIYDRHDSELRDRGVHISAPVISVDVDHDRYTPTFGYDIRGNHYELTGKTSKTPWQVGQRGNILYDRNRPAHAMMDPGERGWGWTILSLVGGVLLALVGLSWRGMTWRPEAGWLNFTWRFW